MQTIHSVSEKPRCVLPNNSQLDGIEVLQLIKSNNFFIKLQTFWEGQFNSRGPRLLVGISEPGLLAQDSFFEDRKAGWTGYVSISELSHEQSEGT